MDYEKADEDIYNKGEAVGVYTIPKEILNMLCENLIRQGYLIDWHYAGARAVVKTLEKNRVENFKKIFGMFQLLSEMYDESYLAGVEF